MSAEVEQIFRQAGGILEGHFLLASGKHSPVYWEKFRVLQYPHHTQRLCQMIAQHFQSKGVQVVAGPTTGGILIAFEVARQMGVRAIFAEREGSARGFRRGLTIAPQEKVLVVDDVMTTGDSLLQVIAEVNRLRGDIVGVGILVDRTQGKVNFGFPLFACYQAPAAPTYSPEKCPQCRLGMPLVKPGTSGSAS